MRTLEELKERIADTLDEITILEILNINSEDLVERFEDKIEERFDILVEDLFGEEENDDQEAR